MTFGTNKLSPERYLANKEYFDKCLIECLERQLKTISDLKFRNEVKDAMIFKLKGRITNQNLKIREQKVIVDSFKSKDKDINLLIDSLKAEIRKLYSKLETLFSDNVRLKEENKTMKDELISFKESHPNIKKKYIPEYIKTLQRMKKYKKEHLLFLHDFAVPFDNNAALSSQIYYPQTFS